MDNRISIARVHHLSTVPGSSQTHVHFEDVWVEEGGCDPHMDFFFGYIFRENGVRPIHGRIASTGVYMVLSENRIIQNRLQKIMNVRTWQRTCFYLRASK